jgi:HAE1 family hydrophobic/amphiphilic exporter-1
MYLLGYSLDNLSLMALTLAVGFVVDDAIVMLENIVRHMEHGASAMEASLKGAQEVAFTIVSMTVSLVAVFIPVLFMGGIVGRLLHEFAVTISVAILISGFVSVSLTPMLAARWLRPGTHLRHGRAYMAIEHVFEWSRKIYGRTLWTTLRHKWVTLAMSFALLGATVYMFRAIPKGFIPTVDTGQIKRDDGVCAGHRLRCDGRPPEGGGGHHQSRSERLPVHVERRQRPGRRRGYRPGPHEHRPQAVP